jgi:hypothetical protein
MDLSNFLSGDVTLAILYSSCLRKQLLDEEKLRTVIRPIVFLKQSKTPSDDAIETTIYIYIYIRA